MIEFESVGKTYKDGTSAVVDLDLVVPSGQITVIVGPSGCGKTTTLRMVNRMLEPTSGRITWDGTSIKSRRKTALRRQMGYVIQSGGLFPHRSVVDNIGTVPALLGWNREKTRSRSLELLGSVGLDRKLADRYPAQLSGGQQQRVGVARALAADPLVLLMDEPFSAVDPVVRSELHEFFLDLQRELSKTIILITHDIDEAIKLGDRVAILRVGGRLAQAGTPQEVLEKPADAFVEGFVGRDRGYRSLSFMPASELHLDRVQAVRDPAAATGDEHALIIDAAAKPLGWTDPRQPGRSLPLGSTFDPETDTLRVALDAALTSPAGLAVAVGKNGRYAGVAGAADILQRVAETRASQTESITIVPAADEPESDSEPVEDPAASGSGLGEEPIAGSRSDHVEEPITGSRSEPVDEPMAPSPEPVEEPVAGSRSEPVEEPMAPSPEPVEGSVDHQERSSTSPDHEVAPTSPDHEGSSTSPDHTGSTAVAPPEASDPGAQTGSSAVADRTDDPEGLDPETRRDRPQP